MIFGKLITNCQLGFYIFKRVRFSSFSKKIFYSLPFSKNIFRSFVLKKYTLTDIKKKLEKFDWDSLNHLKVSVVIPNNNGLDMGLEKLINSIKSQSHKNIEIISVDSGSIDNSVKVMKRLGVQVFEISPP